MYVGNLYIRRYYTYYVCYAVLYLEISLRRDKIKVSKNKGGQAQLDVKSSK